MSNINDYFAQSELAQAAYGTFPSNVMTATELTNDVVGMSSNQANEFISKWQVVAQSPDSITGFSATVFQSKRPLHNSLSGKFYILRRLILLVSNTRYRAESS